MPDAFIVISSPLPGTFPVLQLLPVSQSPLLELVQATDAGARRSSSRSSQGIDHRARQPLVRVDFFFRLDQKGTAITGSFANVRKSVDNEAPLMTGRSGGKRRGESR